MSIKTLLGWLLIFSGILLVFWSVQETYNNFTGKSEFPEVFQSEVIEEVKETAGNSVEDQMGSIIREQIQNMIPQDTTTKMLNMVAWIMLATFFVFSGSKIVGMGASLLRTPKEE